MLYSFGLTLRSFDLADNSTFDPNRWRPVLGSLDLQPISLDFPILKFYSYPPRTGGVHSHIRNEYGPSLYSPEADSRSSARMRVCAEFLSPGDGALLGV